jgi:hypothetical protein
MTSRTTRFLGIVTGAMVSLTALQAGQTASLGPIAWGVDPGQVPSSSIHLEPGTGEAGMSATAIVHYRPVLSVAPEQVAYRGTVTGSGVTEGASDAYDPQGHDLQWVWQFEKVGDPAWQLSAYSAPQRGLPGWHLKGTSRHKRTVMVYDEPGEYDAYVTVIRRSDGARATSPRVRITVGDPNAVFTSAQTWIVAGDGNYTGAPANAGQFTTLQAAWNAVNAANPTRARILCKRGTSVGGFSTTNQQNTAVQTILVGAWGSGNRPITGGINTNMQTVFPAGGLDRDWRFVDLQPTGDYNDATGAGSRFTAFLMTNENNVSFTFANIRCDRNGGLGFQHFIDGRFAKIAVSNCEVIGSAAGASGLFSDCVHVAIIGCRSTRDSNALALRAGGNNQPDGYGWRSAGCDWLTECRSLDMFVNTTNHFTVPSEHIQLSLRPRNNNGVNGAYLNIHQVWSETCIGLGNDAGFANTANVSDIFVIPSWSVPGDLFSCSGGGAQFENVVGIIPPNSERVGPNGASAAGLAFIRLENGANDFGGSRALLNRAMNCTFVDLTDRSDARPIWRINNLITGPVTDTNVLRHIPHASSGAINAGAFVLTELYPARWTGFRSYNRALMPATVTPTHVVELSGATGTFSEGTSDSSTTTDVTITAPGTVTAKVAQRQTTGGVTRLWLYDVTGTIASGAMVTVSSGGSGTAVAAMAPARIMRAWQPTFNPGADAGLFSRVSITGQLQTTAFRGAWPQAA